MNSIALNLEPHQFLAGWRPEAGALFVPALSESRVGEQVVARIGLFGQPVRATVYGKVAMVRRVGRPSLPPGVEIYLDRASVPAARFLAQVASGEPVTYQSRAPRYAVEREIEVTLRRGMVVHARTLSLSEGGCSIAWPDSEEQPTPGELLALRVGTGFFAPVAGGIVAWVSNGDPERAFGVRIVPEGRGGRAWRTLLDEATRLRARST
jgi:Tfp pilus assembly protein PilZ